MLLLMLGALAWLVYTGRVVLSEWTQKLDRLLGMSPSERHEPDYFAEEADAGLSAAESRTGQRTEPTAFPRSGSRRRAGAGKTRRAATFPGA
ncbi:hypothetical protein JOS77_29890 [Chromobacterium haemolyticum]|nr:hypothetical protein JOS77_29890 [Chromobacterium haemolyticum]